jgi:hypothetical protein
LGIAGSWLCIVVIEFSRQGIGVRQPDGDAYAGLAKQKQCQTDAKHSNLFARTPDTIAAKPSNSHFVQKSGGIHRHSGRDAGIQAMDGNFPVV